MTESQGIGSLFSSLREIAELSSNYGVAGTYARLDRINAVALTALGFRATPTQGGASPEGNDGETGAGSSV